MAYGNMSAQNVADQDRRFGRQLGRTPDPVLTAERQRIKNFMSDMSHVTPTGELVTYAPEPFGDKIRMLSKNLDDGGQSAQIASQNASRAQQLWMHLNPQPR